MKRRLQFGGLLIALGISVAMAMPCAAQNRERNKPAQQQRPQQRQAPRQERQQPQGRPGNDRPHTNIAPNRLPPSRPTDSMGMMGGNRPPNARNESAQPNFNPNRPPNATNRPRNFSPEEQRKLQQDERRFRQLPPQQQQEMRDRARVWGRLTPQQRDHIRNDVLPKWQQMSPQRQRAVRQRLGVLQDMPESARNQHLNDPNFTRGMIEEDKAMLRDLSHMHVGAPDPPGE